MSILIFFLVPPAVPGILLSSGLSGAHGEPARNRGSPDSGSRGRLIFLEDSAFFLFCHGADSSAIEYKDAESLSAAFPRIGKLPPGSPKNASPGGGEIDDGRDREARTKASVDQGKIGKDLPDGLRGRQGKLT